MLRHRHKSAFAQNVDSFPGLLEGIDKWATLSAIVEETQKTVEEVLQAILYPSDQVVRLVIFLNKELEQTWAGAFETDFCLVQEQQKICGHHTTLLCPHRRQDGCDGGGS